MTQKNMQVIEVEDDLAIKTCSMYNYKYAVITPDDLVIPPSNEKIQKDIFLEDLIKLKI